MLNVGDRYIFHSENGLEYTIEIINISEYRESSMKYACDVYDSIGHYAEDYIFLGDKFFEDNKDKLVRISSSNATDVQTEMEKKDCNNCNRRCLYSRKCLHCQKYYYWNYKSPKLNSTYPWGLSFCSESCKRASNEVWKLEMMQYDDCEMKMKGDTE